MSHSRNCTHGIVLLAVCAFGCASRPRTSTPKPPLAQSVEERLEEPYLPVRTEFTVMLEQPIGTMVASQTRTFTARVRHPVRSPENEIVLQSDARVRGTIVSIDQKPALVIKLRFDDIETVWGRAPLGATIRSADPYASATPGFGDRNVGYDAALHLPSLPPAPAVLSDGIAAIGGGPSPASEATAILLPKGAELRVLLVRPLVVPPSARSRR